MLCTETQNMAELVLDSYCCCEDNWWCASGGSEAMTSFLRADATH